jgi:hypothetical protein
MRFPPHRESQPVRRDEGPKAGPVLPGSERLRHLQMLDADTTLTRAVIGDAISMGTRRLQSGGNGEPFIHLSAPQFEVLLMKERTCARLWIDDS